jgi:hypothetical protein
MGQSFYDKKIQFISNKADFPAAIAGVITLADNVTYYLLDMIDLSGDRIVCGANTVIIGGSSENCGLMSTGLSAATALITSSYSLPLRDIRITHGKGVQLDASLVANQALDWYGVNFVDCTTIGYIKGYTNFIANNCAFLNCGAFTFDGTIGTIGFLSCLFDCIAAGTSIILPSSLTVARRFRVVYSAFVTLAGETSLNVSTSATIPVEGYILAAVNFSGGGTYTTGVQYTDNKAFFQNCRGITNSASQAQLSMLNNATATTIASTSLFYKILGTTVPSSINQKFSHTNNRLTYTGALSGQFKVSAIASMTSGNNQLLILRTAKNGTTIAESESQTNTSGAARSENLKSQCIVELNTGDFIEMFIQNNTSTSSVTVSELNVIIESLS